MTTFLSTTDLDTLLKNQWDNLAGADVDLRVMWYNFMQEFTYDKFVAINPNDYLLIYTIKTLANISAYALPSDWQDIKTQDSGLFEVTTTSISDASFGAINYDAETVAFTTIGQTITHTSGAFGTLVEVVDFGTTGTLRLSNVDTTAGSFTDNGTLTGSTEGSATSNGTLISFDYSTIRVGTETHLGSTQQGAWYDLTNINLTPEPSTSQVRILRYVPSLTEISDGGTTLIPQRFKQFAFRATDLFLSQYRRNGNDEFLANQRFITALSNLLPNIRKTPSVRSMPRMRGFYAQAGRVTDNPKRFRLSDH